MNEVIKDTSPGTMVGPNQRTVTNTIQIYRPVAYYSQKKKNFGTGSASEERYFGT